MGGRRPPGGLVGGGGGGQTGIDARVRLQVRTWEGLTQHMSSRFPSRLPNVPAYRKLSCADTFCSGAYWSRGLAATQRRCSARSSTWNRGQLDPPAGLRQAAAQTACAPPPPSAYRAQEALAAQHRRQGCRTIHRRATARRRCRREATPAAAPGGGKGGCWARFSRAANRGMVAAGRTSSRAGDMPWVWAG